MMAEECKHCGKPFKYREVGGGYGSREPEEIDCPHCKKTQRREMTAGGFESEPLTAEEEAAYVADKAKRRG
jgi:hypothetical protein